MKAKRQFVKSCQAACAAQLPGWRKRRSYGLYRCTDDFVQWLVFEASNYAVEVVPAYGIQSLAIQFPAEAISLGGRVRDRRGVAYWIRPDEWAERQADLVDCILSQVAPSVFDPLAVRNVHTFLEPFKEQGEFGMLNYGIAAILAGAVVEGRNYVEKAMAVYDRSSLAWSSVLAHRLRSWLSATPEALLTHIRRDALGGATLLALQCDEYE